MDTRNYDEPFNCGLEDCECSEVSKCGCTYPNNISNYQCKDGKCPANAKTKPAEKEDVCICSPKECDCGSKK